MFPETLMTRLILLRHGLALEGVVIDTLLALAPMNLPSTSSTRFTYVASCV